MTALVRRPKTEVYTSLIYARFGVIAGSGVRLINILPMEVCGDELYARFDEGGLGLPALYSAQISNSKTIP